MALAPQTMEKSPDQTLKPWLLTTLLLSAAYLVSGKLGLLLAIPPGYASAIFPPAGIAVTAAFIYGRRAILGVLLGSFALNLWIGYESTHQFSQLGTITAALIAIASTVQAIVGGQLLRHFIGYPAAFDNLRDILYFQLLASVICLISATLSVGALFVLGLVTADAFLFSWFMWWVGDTLGVLVLLPLTMICLGQPRQLWRRRAATVAVPMLAAFTVLVVLYVNVSNWEHTEIMTEFRLQSQRAADMIQARLEEQESLLEQTQGFFAANQNVSDEDFRKFSRKALLRFPMIQAIEWAPRIESAQRREFEAKQQQRLPGFQISEHDQHRVLRAAKERAVYYPVTYAEPLESNQFVFGFDLLSTQDRAAALLQAVRSTRSIATQPIHLLQATKDTYGFLLLHAVRTRTTDEGVVLTVIRVDDFLDKLLPSGKEQLQIQLTDVETGTLFYNSFANPGTQAQWQQKIIYGQREFLFATAPSAAYLAQHQGWQSVTLLSASILGIGLLGAFLMLGTGYTARVESQVQQQMAELNESSEKLTTLYQLSPLGIVFTALDGRFLEFNAAFERITGYSADELKTLDYFTLTPEKYMPDELVQLETLMKHGRYGPYEKEYRRKDGTLIAIRLNGLLLNGKDGEHYAWSLIEDISEQKQTEEILRSSEERWKFALEGSGDGVWDWNLQTGMLFLSRQEMVVLGYAGEESQQVDFTGWLARIHPADQSSRKQAMDAYLSGKTPIYSCEMRTRCRDGHWKWIRTRGMLISRTADGKPLRMIGTHTDIDEQKRQQRQEAMHNTVMEMLAHGIELHKILDQIIVSLEQDNEELSYAVFSHDGDDEHALANTTLPEFWYPKQPDIGLGTEYPAVRHHPAAATSGGVTMHHTEAIVLGNGRVEGVLVAFCKQSNATVAPDIRQQQQAAALIATAIEHKRIAEQLLLANSVYMASSEAIMVVDAANRIVAINPAFEKITGFNAQDALGHDPKLMKSDYYSPEFYKEMWQTILASGSWSGEIWNRRKNGTIYPAMMNISTIYGDDHQILRRIAIFTDITDKKRAEEQIYHLAHHDLLTNLPNRVLYTDRLSLALSAAHRNRTRLALLYIDLDKFKPVNDTLGHAIGDLLLKQVAQRLLDCVRESDTIARIGGDEFVAILPAVQSTADAHNIGEKIRAALEQPFIIDEHVLQISASIGGALYPDHGSNETQLIQHADNAMYQAKARGRNTVCIETSTNS
ncbi:diguanylate cyclase domain-containing protein [Chitinibacter sp. S2-10]|uniref:diguanylate cyclase domain-containing protein n=1 Tax=Chitinibacter sp. S2-10 TaxID=3373597 RepID=UPI003977D7F7